MVKPEPRVISLAKFETEHDTNNIRKEAKRTRRSGVVSSTSATGVPRSGANQASILITVVVSIPVSCTRDRAAGSSRRARGGGGGSRLGGSGGLATARKRNLLAARGRSCGRGGNLGGRSTRSRGGGNGGRRAALGRVADTAGGAARVVADDGGRDEICVQQRTVYVETVVDLGDGVVVAEEHGVLAEGVGDGGDDGLGCVGLGFGRDDTGIVENL